VAALNYALAKCAVLHAKCMTYFMKHSFAGALVKQLLLHWCAFSSSLATVERRILPTELEHAALTLQTICLIDT